MEKMGENVLRMVRRAAIAEGPHTSLRAEFVRLTRTNNDPALRPELRNLRRTHS